MNTADRRAAYQDEERRLAAWAAAVRAHDRRRRARGGLAAFGVAGAVVLFSLWLVFQAGRHQGIQEGYVRCYGILTQEWEVTWEP